MISKALKPIILLCLYFSVTACEEQTVQRFQAIDDYETARGVFWKQLYHHGGETFYCGEKFEAGYNKGINIEHIFPMGWVTYALKCGKRKECRKNSNLFNRIEADLHNLYPARSDINQARSSIAFGHIVGEKREYGRCDFEIQHHRPRLVEARDEVRGNIARAMFYMTDRYELKLFEKQVTLLKKWHKEDPVDDFEMNRNEQIEKIQGNRNAYIDGKAF